LALLAAGAAVFQAALSSERVVDRNRSAPFITRMKLRGLTTLLYLLQPLARLIGRIRHGLAPWRKRCAPSFAFPWPRTLTSWSEKMRTAEERLESIESTLRSSGAAVMRGNEHSRWDLQVWGSLFGAVRARMAVEQHDDGKQRTRLRLWPKLNLLTLAMLAVLSALSLAAAADQAWTAAAILALLAVLLGFRSVADASAAMASCANALRSTEGQPPRGTTTESR
jgi:hypothetical protein